MAPGGIMNQAVIEMLEKYDIQHPKDAENALKEIIQEIALLGLQRSNFFEKAAFYGGTALRVLYSLPRFSEDLDFTLYKPDKTFSLNPYFSAVKTELNAYGFHVEVETIDKKIKSDVESAFIKANTKMHLLKIKTTSIYSEKIQADAKLQIKFEVDTDPAVNFGHETRYLLQPTSFPVTCLTKPDLFAGKLHALLFRKWKNRIKGRDFYDYVWYLKTKTPVRLDYLREKAVQSGHIKPDELKDLGALKTLLSHRFASIDFSKAREDVLPFIKDSSELKLWSHDFFSQITEQLILS
jgi:predicted nucleotidyltransferase component of viral defense system